MFRTTLSLGRDVFAREGSHVATLARISTIPFHWGSLLPTWAGILIAADFDGLVIEAEVVVRKRVPRSGHAFAGY